MHATFLPVSSEKEIDAPTDMEFHRFGDISERQSITHTSILGYPEWSRQDSGVVSDGILDSRLTFASFIELKFVPDHVRHKTRSGYTHYQAMLKHVITPDTVNRMFMSTPKTKRRLTAIPGWPYLDHVRLCDITSTHVGRILSAANSKGYSSQTIKHLKNVIGMVISHAQKEGCFSGRNPAADVRLSPVRHTRKSAVTMRQLNMALQIMDYPDKQIALIAMFTGLSISDICDLRWRQVNLGASPLVWGHELIPPFTIAIRKDWDQNSLGTVSAGRSKNIEINDALIPVLLDIKSRNCRLGPDDFLVTSPNGTQMVDANTRRATLKRLAAILGVPSLTWNSFKKMHKMLVPEFLYQPAYSSRWREQLHSGSFQE